MTNIKTLLSEIEKSKKLLPAETELIQKAFDFSEKAHQNQKRKSDEPYFNHAYETAFKLAQWRLDIQTIAAGLLHDIAEDTPYSIKDIQKEFGEEIASLVDGVTKISLIKYREDKKETTKTQLQNQSENLRKMILALSRDLRVVLIKLADRLHNMKTLAALSQTSQKQKRIALETSEIYSPLAYRLGMSNLAGELEDLAFPYTNPEEYKWIVENIQERYEERQKYLEKVREIIEKTIKDNGIEPLKIDSRAKRYSSLYKKLVRSDMNLEQVYDLVALRIIVKTIEECYAVMGIVHQLWPPLPGRIKDYIALPKPNGYRSLHTTVICLDGKPTEFQIRTEEMHNEAENGIAAYWAYSQAKDTKNYQKGKTIFAEKKELLWIKQLKDWQKEMSGSEEFLSSLKIDFFKDRIFAISPKGKVVDLPAGATPVDFAYAIHSEIGNQCVGAKVNEKLIPLDYQLQSGDLVEILIQKSKKPSESWLNFIKTDSARKKIKAAIRNPLLKLKKQKTVEFKIAVIDRMGLLKDISSIFSKSNINILSTTASAERGYHCVKIRCEINKERTGKIILKLKRIKGVREINWKTN